MPAIRDVCGIQAVASTTDGARRLSSAVDSADSGILSSLGSWFGGGFSTDRSGGILRIAPGRLGAIRPYIGYRKIIRAQRQIVRVFLAFLVPVVLGMLKKIKDTRGLDATGLSNLLAGRESNIAAAMPEGMRRAGEPGYTREPLNDVSRDVPYETERNVRRRGRVHKSAGWVVRFMLTRFTGNDLIRILRRA